jgi:hypothetical protein
MRAEEYLVKFVDILMRLEKTGAGNGEIGRSDGTLDVMTPLDEEQELRNWADLKEYQLRFAARGGFMGDV